MGVMELKEAGDLSRSSVEGLAAVAAESPPPQWREGGGEWSISWIRWRRERGESPFHFLLFFPREDICVAY